MIIFKAERNGIIYDVKPLITNGILPLLESEKYGIIASYGGKYNLYIEGDTFYGRTHTKILEIDAIGGIIKSKYSTGIILVENFSEFNENFDIYSICVYTPDIKENSRRLYTKEEIKEWLDSMEIENYIINEDLTVDVWGTTEQKEKECAENAPSFHHGDTKITKGKCYIFEEWGTTASAVKLEIVDVTKTTVAYRNPDTNGGVCRLKHSKFIKEYDKVLEEL